MTIPLIEQVEQVIGRELDMPSVYISGASPGSRRKARAIIEQLEQNGIRLVADECEQ